MLNSVHGKWLRAGVWLAVVLAPAPFITPALAQVPTGQLPGGQQAPSPQQAQEILRNPEIVEQLRQRLAQSGLTPDQIRARLRAAGYPEGLLDEYLSGADTTQPVQIGPRDIEAVRSLGVLSDAAADSLKFIDSTRVISDSMQALLDSLKERRLDSLRADSLADSVAVLRGAGLKLFGIETFRRTSTRFKAAEAGPVDQNYRLGPGDMLVLILTGDVERSQMLEVTREGFVVIPQVGQVYVANLTLGQLEDQLYTRLGRVYSGVRRTNPSTKFQISLARLRNIQVYVAGDVVRPGAYQISSAGTVLSALYAAGGPTANGSFRRVLIKRGRETVDSLDLYDYLIGGSNPTDIRLQSGDVVFVPVHGGFASVTGRVQRPAIYELRSSETLRDAIGFAGGLDPTAAQTRVTIHRILPPESRGPDGRARVVIAVGADQFSGGVIPAVPMAPGDSVTVHPVADRRRGFVTVRGNVWVEGEVGFTPGMKLSDAIRLAGGAKPDVYLPRILVTRMREDSSFVQLRSAFADSTGRLQNDMVLEDQDEVRIFSRTSFMPDKYVAVVGAVRRPGRVPYREGMTMRDLILLADGLADDAQLEAEIARLPESRPPGALAQTVRVALDSSFLFGRLGGATGGSDGAAAAGDTPLEPYDNVLVLRQGEFGRQRTVVLTGQVKSPGRYSLTSKTERLADLIARAGGLTAEAYPGGIQFYRSYVGVRPAGDDNLPSIMVAGARRDSVRRGLPERVGIDLPRALKNPKDPENIILASGDSIHIPEYNPVVMVLGAVNSPGPVAYTPNKNLDWYVDAAGGYTQTGDTRHPYLTQPNGEREGVKRRAIFADKVPKPAAGAVVFVPTRTVQEQPSGNLAAILGTAAQVLGALVTIVVVAKR
ncbi:MAG TPA: SLBB domain-containing protein [Gemmatimonadales bacterium]|nr:SLBB domain-containing protein [Gemmatimonadales bacterium]